MNVSGRALAVGRLVAAGKLVATVKGPTPAASASPLTIFVSVHQLSLPEEITLG